MVAQPSLEQTIGHSQAFRDKRHPGKKDMQRSRCGADQIAANNGFQMTSSCVCLIMAVFLALIAALTGCAVHYTTDRDLRSPQPVPDAVAAEFAYPKTDVMYSETLLEDKDAYIVRRIEFESTHNVIPVPHTIRMDYYALKDFKKAPVIMVLPILGGRNVIAEIFARYFVENGYAAVIVHRQQEYKELADLKLLNPTLQQMVIDHMQAVDWVETRTELDASRIGVFGVSMGSIKAAMLAPVDRRIKAAVLGLPGGDIPYVLSYSTESGVKRARSKYLEETGLTPDLLYAYLQEEITCDPIHHAPYMDPANVLMFIAWFDDAVPYSRGNALWREAGKPEVVYLVAGHFSAYLYLPYVKARTLSFFNRRLVADAGLP